MNKRLEVKAEKEIGKSARCLDTSDDNMLSPQDIWARLLQSLPVTKELNSKILVLRNGDLTMLVLKECANAMFIFRLLDMYSAGAVGIRGIIESLELADAGLFELSVFASASESWHVGIKQLVVLAIDLKLKERATNIGDKLIRDKTEGIDRHFGGRPYPIKRDIALMELSCYKDVTNKLKNCSSKSLANVTFYGKASNQTSRVPVVLKFGSTASAFPENTPATYESIFGFTTEVMSRARVWF